MVYTKNTWRTDDIITADKLNNMENGILDQHNSKELTIDNISVVTSDMLKYAGSWGVNTSVIKGIPNIAFAVMEVVPYPNNKTSGVIKLSSTYDFVDGVKVGFQSYIGYVISSTISSWVKLPDDSNVVHKTGDETVVGNKSFTGNVSIAGSVMNYATIPSVSITGYVSGSLKVSKQSGMVSITSMDLVLTKGAKVTLPAGYYPRAQLQAPITGQNGAGTTAGGYMTVDVDGSVTFNSMGFASGNATAYVNVHYIAQV